MVTPLATPRPTIITIANGKGGVNKTTISVNLSHGLARRGKKTLLMDFDPQGQDATFLGRDPESGVFDYLVSQASAANVVRETGRENLHLLPGNSRTKTAETVIRNENSLGEAVSRLRSLAHSHEVTVIDTPPSGLFQEIGLMLADVLIIPVRPESLALEGVANIMRMSKQIGQAQSILIVPTDFNRVWSEHHSNLEALKQQFPDHVFCWPIARRAAMCELPSYSITIYEANNYKELGTVIAAFETLIDCLIGEKDDCTTATA